MARNFNFKEESTIPNFGTKIEKRKDDFQISKISNPISFAISKESLILVYFIQIIQKLNCLVIFILIIYLTHIKQNFKLVIYLHMEVQPFLGDLSKKLLAVTSSSHAKIIAIHESSRECIWLRSMTYNIQKSYGLSSEKENPSTVLYEDNAMV